MAYAEGAHTMSKISSYTDTIANLFRFHVNGRTLEFTTVEVNLGYY